MSRRRFTWRTFFAQRWIGAAALALLVHAVAIDTLHHHAFGATLRTHDVMTAHVDRDAASTDAPGNCPACQMQQNSAAVAPRTVELFAVETTSFLLPTERLRTILRAGDTSPPDRAPPVL